MSDTPEFAKIRALAQADRRVGACDTQEIARIRAALAAGPTPGPWVSSPSDLWSTPSGKFCQWGRYLISAGSKDVQVDDYYRIAAVSNINDKPENKANADLIEACNPAAMTALLAHIDAQAAEIERLRADAGHAVALPDNAGDKPPQVGLE